MQECSEKFGFIHVLQTLNLSFNEFVEGFLRFKWGWEAVFVIYSPILSGMFFTLILVVTLVQNIK